MSRHNSTGQHNWGWWHMNKDDTANEVSYQDITYSGNTTK